MLVVLLSIPIVATLAAVFWRHASAPLRILPVTAATHLVVSLIVLATRTVTEADDPISRGLWLRLDATGSVVLLGLTLLFALIAAYVPGYLRTQPDRSSRVLVTCLCAFLGLTTAATVSQHLGLMWALIEAATLCCVPLVYLNQNPRSLEATWKFLMVGGVGLALALLGTFFLAYSAIAGQTGLGALTYEALQQQATHLSQPWLRAAFVLLLVGYGTKMGLAPLHTWKPDAYGETPGLVGGLLAGGMTSVAFLALLRVTSVVEATGSGGFARQLLLALGLLSMGWAAVFMIRQTDIKRMLAYSSVEHMGILAIGLGLGPAALPWILLHLLGNTLAKATLFLSAGNLHRAFASKHIPAISGAVLRVPVSASLFLLGFLAATGSPPSCLFISEFGLLRTAFDGHHYWTAGLFLAFLAIVFLGFSATVLSAVLGDTDAPEPIAAHRDRPDTTVAPILALVLVVLLGLWIPAPLQRWFKEAQADLERFLPPPAAVLGNPNATIPIVKETP